MLSPEQQMDDKVVFKIVSPLMLAGLFLATWLADATAQQPTPAQQNAIRASCRSDFIANCSGIQPGGREALECLLRNSANLSGACKTAVNAISAPRQAAPTKVESGPGAAQGAGQSVAAPAPAPVPSREGELNSVRQACSLNDFVTHCSSIAPTSPEVLACLKANVTDLSFACQNALQSIPAAPAVAATPPAESPKPTPAKPAASPLGRMPRLSPREALVILRICGPDDRALCPDVQPGGGRVISCLARHASALSPGCYAALSAAARR